MGFRDRVRTTLCERTRSTISVDSAAYRRHVKARQEVPGEVEQMRESHRDATHSHAHSSGTRKFLTPKATNNAYTDGESGWDEVNRENLWRAFQ